MSVNWGDALRVAAVGFLGVFTILVILSLTVALTASVVRRIEKRTTKPGPPGTSA